MTARTPLVLVSGKVQQLQSGDNISLASYQNAYVNMTNKDVGANVIGTPVYASAAGQYKKAENGDTYAKAKVIGLQLDASVAADAAGDILVNNTLMTATTTQWDAVCGTTGGLTAGTNYYLDVTAGLLTATPPTAGYSLKVIHAVSTTQARVEIGEPILL